MEEPSFIDLQSDEYFMRQALREAYKALAADEVPVGAVMVHEGKIISRAWNQVETLKDATAHAEMLCLTAAQSAIGDWRLEGCTLYVTNDASDKIKNDTATYVVWESPISLVTPYQFSPLLYSAFAIQMAANKVTRKR